MTRQHEQSDPEPCGVAPHAGSETKLMANQQRPNLLPRGPTETDLPAALRRDRIEAYRKQFCRDYNPTSFTERVIINDLARRAANMDLLENVADALQRQGALALIDVTLPLAENSGAIAEDVVLAGAVASGRIDELSLLITPSSFADKDLRRLPFRPAAG